MGELTSTSSWSSWLSPNSMLVLSGLCLIPCRLSALVWRPNLQHFHLHHLFGRRLYRRVRWLAEIVDPDLSVTINEYESTGRTMRRGDVYYEEVKAYLGGERSRTARHLRAEGASSDAADRLVLSMVDGEEIADEFQGATVWWSAYSSTRRIDGSEHDERLFKLHYQERHRELVLRNYLVHVRQQGRDIMANNRKRKLFTSVSDDHHDGWCHVVFEHPKTFATLAVDPAKKKEIVDDLDMFKGSKERYARVGKAWKRGYLLYGPPGTGKSTMIAAMANHLQYDVYIVELTSIKSNTKLQKLLIEVKSKSVIVIEDIDCSLHLTGARAREKKKRPAEGGNGASTSSAAASNSSATEADARSKVTLSGLLNVVDGLWVACGGERIIVFTTNHVNKLDPALIRRGRMDKHIEMSYCGFEAFKFLAKTYLDVDDHDLSFDTVKELLREVEMTPADVIEEMTPKNLEDNADSCLAALVEALETKAKEDKANAGPSA